MRISHVGVVMAVAVAAAVVFPVSATASGGTGCSTMKVRQATDVHYDPAFTSPVVRTARKGETDTVCLIAVGRDGAFSACGRGGTDWALLHGGFVPLSCMRRV